MRLLRILFALTLLLPINAASSESLRHHIIIAIDKAGCDDWIGVNEVGKSIQNLLNANAPGNDKGRHLYEPGDYLSIVGFRINISQTDMNVFTLPISGDDQKLAYQNYSIDQLKNLLTNKWSDIALKPYNSGAGGFSLVSVAKEYALSALKTNGQRVNRTFLIMVTDRHYNGNNFYDEMKAFELKQTENHQRSHLSTKDIFKRCYEVQQYYYCRYISTNNIWAGKSYVKGYVECYEYVPLQRNFTLSAAVNYPTHLKAMKKRNGNYQLELPLEWSGGDLYSFSHLEAFPNDKDTVIFKTPEDAQKLDSLTKQTLVFDNLPSDQSVKAIQLRAWLRLIDGFYDATLLSPDENSPIESGRNGLNTLVPIEYEEDATLLGITLPGILWPPFVNDQHTAVKVWKVFLWVVFIGLLLWIGYLLVRPETYRPRAEDFKVIYKKKTSGNESESNENN